MTRVQAGTSFWQPTRLMLLLTWLLVLTPQTCAWTLARTRPWTPTQLALTPATTAATSLNPAAPATATAPPPPAGAPAPRA